jgi:hypothetical protein
MPDIQPAGPVRSVALSENAKTVVTYEWPDPPARIAITVNWPGTESAARRAGLARLRDFIDQELRLETAPVRGGVT